MWCYHGHDLFGCLCWFLSLQGWNLCFHCFMLVWFAHYHFFLFYDVDEAVMNFRVWRWIIFFLFLHHAVVGPFWACRPERRTLCLALPVMLSDGEAMTVRETAQHHRLCLWDFEADITWFGLCSWSGGWFMAVSLGRNKWCWRINRAAAGQYIILYRLWSFKTRRQHSINGTQIRPC